MGLPQTIAAPRTAELLPAFMQVDDANRALAAFLDEVLAPVGSRVKALSVWGYIDDLTTAELDELAYSLGVDWWDSTATIDRKRETIKNARQIKSKRGTAWSVETAANTLGPATVIPWYDYGGQPKHFRIRVDGPYPGVDAVERFRNAVEKSKPASAVLDAIAFANPTIQTVFFGSAKNASIKITAASAVSYEEEENSNV